MEKGIVFDSMPERVEDLGTGSSNVHLNITEQAGTDEEGAAVVRYVADVVRVQNPATEENILRQVKEELMAAIKAYDKSPAVNSFTIGGVRMWIDKDTRVGLNLRFAAEKAAGITDTVLWGETGNFAGTIAQAEGIMMAVELYASVCYDKTATNVVTMMGLADAGQVAGFDYKSGYPEKLAF